MKADIREHLQRDLGSAFLLGRELGGGGMSRVFLATERALGRAVVLKVLPPEVGGDVSVERFRREVALTARLQHPNIVPVLSAGEAHTVHGGHGLLYYTMPFVNGETLRERLERVGEFPISDAVSIIRDVSRALAFAHSQGIIHRDLKPENVLIAGEAAAVTDFGIAKALVSADKNAQGDNKGDTMRGKPLTSVGLAVGTPAYMAPEQIAVDPSVDHRSDLYALGVVSYEIIAGAHPFAGRRAVALLAAHANETPEHLAKRRPDVPPGLASLVMSLLEKNPSDRPQSAEIVLRKLDEIVTGDTPISMPRGSRAPARSPWPMVIGLIAVLLILAVSVYFLARGRGERRATTSGATAVASAASISDLVRGVGFPDGA